MKIIYSSSQNIVINHKNFVNNNNNNNNNINNQKQAKNLT